MSGRAAAWAQRARQEAAAAATFRRLADDLVDLERGTGLPEALQVAAGDEDRHARRCYARAVTLGAPADAAPPLVATPSVAGGAWGRRQRAAMHLVGSLCVGESVSVALLALALRHPDDLEDAAIDREILADEVTHARLGFTWLAASWRGLPYSLRLAVEAWLPQVLVHHATSRRGEARSVVEHALRARVVPALERHGVAVAGGLP